MKFMKMKHLSMISAGARKSLRAILGHVALGTVCVVAFIEPSHATGTFRGGHAHRNREVRRRISVHLDSD